MRRRGSGCGVTACVKLRSGYNAALWAMEHQFLSINSSVSEQIQSLRKKVEKEFGGSALLSSHILGPFMLWMARREERRLAAGKTYEHLRSSNAPTGRPPKVIHFPVLDKPAPNASSEVA